MPNTLSVYPYHDLKRSCMQENTDVFCNFVSMKVLHRFNKNTDFTYLVFCIFPKDRRRLHISELYLSI